MMIKIIEFSLRSKYLWYNTLSCSHRFDWKTKHVKNIRWQYLRWDKRNICWTRAICISLIFRHLPTRNTERQSLKTILGKDSISLREMKSLAIFLSIINTFYVFFKCYNCFIRLHFRLGIKKTFKKWESCYDACSEWIPSLLI